MADNPITPGAPTPPPGGLPPRPGDAAKVQPKKETVRISLPPKPSATATIKLPSIPAGGAPTAPGVVAPPSPSAPLTPAPSAAPLPPRPPTAGATPAPAIARPPTSTGAPAPRPPSSAPRPAPAAVIVKKISGFDVGLAIAAAVVGIGAIVTVFLLKQIQ